MPICVPGTAPLHWPILHIYASFNYHKLLMSDSGLTGTKRDIVALLLKQELSAAALAGLLKVSGAAIRQHLQTLEGMNLVERRKQASQPGRPAYLYRLSPSGKARFRQRHDLLLALVVEILLRREGAAGVESLLREAAQRMADALPLPLRRSGAPQDWGALAAWLEEQLAWNAEQSKVSGGTQLVIYRCPFQGVSADQSSICGTFFCALLERLCAGSEVRHAPLRDGAACCSLTVRPPSA